MDRKKRVFTNQGSKKVKPSPQKCDPASMWPECFEILRQSLNENYFQLCKKILGNHESTPLHLAICYGCDCETVENIIRHGADIFALDSAGNRPFQVAIQRGDVDIAELLLNCGVQVNYPSRYHYTKGKTALHEAAEYGKDNIVELLLDRGASVEAVTEYSKKMDYTPLHFAAECGNSRIIELLVEKNADINAAADSITPVFTAAIANKIDAVKTLVERGASLNISQFNSGPCSGTYQSLLRNIIRHCTLETLQVLLDGGFDVNSTDHSGNTLLHIAVETGKLNALHKLLLSGANVNALNSLGQTALHNIVTSSGSSSLATSNLLIDAGIDINIVDRKGDTALLAAMRREMPCLIINLIENNGVILFNEQSYSVFSHLLDVVDDSHYSELPSRIVKRHLIALSVTGEYNSDSPLFEIVSDLLDEEEGSELSNFKEACKAEIESMKKLKVTPNSYISFHKILMGNLNDIQTCLKNKEIYKTLSNSEKILKLYPIYGFKINKMVRSAGERLPLMNSGITAFMTLFDATPLPLPCVEAILDYLSNDELRSLNEMPPRIKSLPPVHFYSEGIYNLLSTNDTLYLMSLRGLVESSSEDSDWDDWDADSDISLADLIINALLFF